MKYDNSNELGCFQVNRPGIDKGTGVERIIDVVDLREKATSRSEMLRGGRPSIPCSA
jgi:hypothetical protein